MSSAGLIIQVNLKRSDEFQDDWRYLPDDWRHLLNDWPQIVDDWRQLPDNLRHLPDTIIGDTSVMIRDIKIPIPAVFTPVKFQHCLTLILIALLICFVNFYVSSTLANGLFIIIFMTLYVYVVWRLRMIIISQEMC